MKINRIFITLFLFGMTFQVNAQEKLSLKKCIDLALENNLTIQQSKLDLEQSAVGVTQSKANFLPTVNGSVNLSRSFGTVFDNVTFQRISRSTNTSAPQLFASLNIFNALKNHNQLKQSKLNQQSSEYALEASKDNIEAAVTLAYLQVVFDQENMKLSQMALDLLEEQRKRVQTLVDAEVSTEQDLYNIKAQIAGEKKNLAQSKTQFQKDLFSLLQYLNISDNKKYAVENIELDAQSIFEKTETLEMIYTESEKNSANLKAQEFSILSASKSIQIARASKFPTLTLNGMLGSNYSSNSTFNYSTGQLVPPENYFTQVGDNFYQGITLTLNVPIFNRLMNFQSIQNAKISFEKSKLTLESAKLDLKKQVQQAYLDLQFAKESFLSSKEQVDASDKAFQITKEKYEAGSVDYYTFRQSMNDKLNAEIGLKQAILEYFFRSRVLDVYMGKEVSYE